MTKLFDDLEQLEHFYDSFYITLDEYFKIKKRIIEKYKREEKTNEKISN